MMPIKRLATLVTFVGVIIFSWFVFNWSFYIDNPSLIREAIAAHEVWAPVVFIIVHILAEVLLIPGGPITVAGGLLFGIWTGSFYSLISSVLSAMIVFAIVRYAGELSFISWLHNRFATFRGYSENLRDNGFKYVFIARLIPFAPNNIINVGLPFTKVKSKDLFWGTLLGNIPSTLVLSGAGSLLAADEIGYFVLIIAIISLASGLPFFLKWYNGRS